MAAGGIDSDGRRRRHHRPAPGVPAQSSRDHHPVSSDTSIRHDNNNNNITFVRYPVCVVPLPAVHDDEYDDDDDTHRRDIYLNARAHGLHYSPVRIKVLSSLARF